MLPFYHILPIFTVEHTEINNRCSRQLKRRKAVRPRCESDRTKLFYTNTMDQFKITFVSLTKYCGVRRELVQAGLQELCKELQG